MEEQIGLSDLTLSLLKTSEKELLSGAPEKLRLALNIDECEEVLDSGDVFALRWVFDHYAEKEDQIAFLRNVEDAYAEFRDIYDTERITNLEHCEEHYEQSYLDSLQFVYCYLKNKRVNNESRWNALKYFMSERTKHKLGGLIVARAIEVYLLDFRGVER